MTSTLSPASSVHTVHSSGQAKLFYTFFIRSNSWLWRRLAFKSFYPCYKSHIKGTKNAMWTLISWTIFQKVEFFYKTTLYASLNRNQGTLNQIMGNSMNSTFSLFLETCKEPFTPSYLHSYPMTSEPVCFNLWTEISASVIEVELYSIVGGVHHIASKMWIQLSEILLVLRSRCFVRVRNFE